MLLGALAFFVDYLNYLFAGVDTTSRSHSLIEGINSPVMVA